MAEKNIPGFTPGPWHVEDEFVFNEKGFRICDTAVPDFAWVATEKQLEEFNAQAEANAHLIAAAPDLYAALKHCVTELEHRNGAWGAVSRSRAALAKAEGRS